MTKLLIILLIGLVFEAFGVVCLSKGLKQLPPMHKVTASGVLKMIKGGITNPTLIMGVAFEAVFFGCLLILMSKGTVSFVWPLTSMSFVMTTLGAKFLLHEEVSKLRWIGVLLIMFGAGVISYTEKLERKGAPAIAEPAVSDSSKD